MPTLISKFIHEIYSQKHRFSFTKENNLWQVQMRAVFIQHRLWKVLSGPHMKSSTMTNEQWVEQQKKKHDSLMDDEWEELELKAFYVIQLCLAPHVLREMLDKTTQWVFGFGWRNFT